MNFIDTHTHLYCDDFDADCTETLNRCAAAGVTTLFLPAIDPETYDRQEEFVNSFDSDKVKLYQMMGLHPTSVKEDWEQQLAQARQRLFDNPDKYVAVGEIGLDYYWDRTFEVQQQEVLKEQMRWADQLNLPVALHVRKAYEEILHLLKELNLSHYRGVMHCFGGDISQARRSIDQGFYIGIGGVVTFKNAGMAEVVKAIPLNRIVLETDSPFLAPVPYRGKRNESAFVVEVAKKIAELKGVSLNEVAEQTTENAKTLFFNR